MPQVAGLDLASSWQPANGVGGDCFDTLTFGTGAIGVSIADVAGKGVPAALLMSNLQAAVRAFAQDGAAPSIGLRQRQPPALPQHGQRPVRDVLLRADRRRRPAKLTYANAGHNPPLLVRADGAIEQLSPGGTVLGVFAESTYEQARLRARRRRSPGLLHRRHHRERATPPATSSARSASPPPPLAHRALQPAEEMLAGDARRHQGFNGGTYEDDATLIVAAL